MNLNDIRFVTKRIESNTLMQLIKNKSLIRHPYVMDNYYWTDDKISLFIESLLIRMPFTNIWLEYTETDIIYVIDGWQRLNALYSFIGNKIKLQDLKLLSQFNGYSYDMFSYQYQRNLRQIDFVCFGLLPNTNTVFKNYIFQLNGKLFEQKWKIK